MRKTDKGDNSVMDLENFTQIRLYPLRIQPVNQIIKYHDSSLSGS